MIKFIHSVSSKWLICFLLFSIPNGYLNNGKVIKGMYDVENDVFDIRYPYKLIKKIEKFLLDNNFKPTIYEVPSEIFIKGER